VTLAHSAYGDLLRQLEVLFDVIPTAAGRRDRAVWVRRSHTT
jgi:hypothetical protein